MATPARAFFAVHRSLPPRFRGRLYRSNANLSEHLQAMKMESKALQGTFADFERVKRASGPEPVEAAVEAAKQREQAEKARKRPQRSPDRGGR